MDLQVAVLSVAALSCGFPMFAVLLGQRSQHLLLVSFLASGLGFFLVSVAGLVVAGPTSEPSIWVYLLMAAAVPAVLSGHLFSLGFGREHPGPSIRRSKKSFLSLLFMGVAFLSVLRHTNFISGFDWDDGRGTIHLGALGKAFVGYLLVAIVAIGYNLESTYQLTPSETRYRLRIPMLGLFGLLGFVTFILSTGMLYSAIGLGKIVAMAIPVFLCNVALAYGYLQGAITDIKAPVSRDVVYSSFTALTVGLFVLAVGVVAQIASFTHWTPDEVIILSFGFLATLLTVLILVSNRFKRRVRRFIDRNFYVNRYDYRTQWFNVTSSMNQVSDRSSVLEQTEKILSEIFSTDNVTISLLDMGSHSIVPTLGTGSGDEVALGIDSPLYAMLAKERKALLLNRNPHDFTYIPIYAENGDWLEKTASQIVVPLFEDDHLVGTIGLARRRGRESLTYEDASLLESIAAHVAAKLRSVRLAQELADSRESELMSQWSSMLLHDLKNYLAPLRMVADNLVHFHDKADITTLASNDIRRVTNRMERLVNTLSELRDTQRLGLQSIDATQMVEAAINDMQVSRREGVEVVLRLESTPTVLADECMLRRVVENLITNAIEAMDGEGQLTIQNRTEISDDASEVIIEVSDTGQGMSKEFIRENLFRPFTSTKKKGLGLGLYQCRLIVQAHGGTLSATSEAGQGSTFQIRLPLDAAVAEHGDGHLLARKAAG